MCYFLLFSTVNDAKGKQKVLGSNKKLKFNPTELILYCKDFRIVRFRFDEAGPETAKKVHMHSHAPENLYTWCILDQTNTLHYTHLMICVR